MKRFWENLSQLSKGMLFSGGYLSKEAVLRLTDDRAGGKSKRATSDVKRHRAASPRLAIPH
ncbi:MAG: hypothetical protein ABJB01_13255 [Rudaea sp.]